MNAPTQVNKEKNFKNFYSAQCQPEAESE